LSLFPLSPFPFPAATATTAAKSEKEKKRPDDEKTEKSIDEKKQGLNDICQSTDHTRGAKSGDLTLAMFARYDV